MPPSRDPLMSVPGRPASALRPTLGGTLVDDLAKRKVLLRDILRGPVEEPLVTPTDREQLDPGHPDARRAGLGVRGGGHPRGIRKAVPNDLADVGAEE